MTQQQNTVDELTELHDGEAVLVQGALDRLTQGLSRTLKAKIWIELSPTPSLPMRHVSSHADICVSSSEPPCWGKSVVYQGRTLAWVLVESTEAIVSDSLIETLRTLASLTEDLLFQGHRTQIASHMQLAFAEENYHTLREKNRELQDANERLQTLDKLKSNFLAMVSHELRTPLTALIGYADMLAQNVTGELNPQQRDFVAIIQNRGEQLLGLIIQLLDASGLDMGPVQLDIKPLTISQLLSDVMDTSAPLAHKKHIALRSNVDEGLSIIMADAIRIRQILQNLVDNAIKFSPENAVVSISVESRSNPLSEQPQSGASVLGALPELIALIVQDQGPGITHQERQRVFDPFYQIDDTITRRHGGVGLGLSIVKQLVHAHGGSITIESRSDGTRGSRFVVHLPNPIQGL